MESVYDLVVIGGGPGGYTAAERAAQNGLRVLLVEERELGGTCLNRGCIPTKVLLKAAHDYQTLARLSEEGIRVSPPTMDFARLAKHKQEVMVRLRGGVQDLMEQNRVDVVQARASFTAPNSLSLNGESSAVHFKHALIATGSRPAPPPFPALRGEGVYTSDDLLSLAEYPKRMLVLGGGVIGVELASVLAGFGSEVSLLEMLPSLLPQLDEELSGALQKRLQKEGVRIYTSATLQQVERKAGNLECQMEQGGHTETLVVDGLLLALGRRANTEGLGLDAAGVRCTKNGAIQTDAQMRTTANNIFAIGDVRGECMLAHAAAAQARVAADVLSGHPAAFSSRAIPNCIYTQPEAACVGLTEAEAKKQGLPVVVGKSTVLANGKSFIMGETEGFAKLVADGNTGEILGAHLLAPRASDMIGELSLALRLECTVRELAATIHPHPTVSEILCEAAEAARRQIR